MKVRVCALILSLVMLLAGCSQSGGTPAPVGDHIAVGITTDFDSLDPHSSTATATQEVMFNIFHGLVNTATDSSVIPELCESYEISDDLMTYTFKLRSGVKFHDGTTMTAADVAYSFLRLMGKTDDQQTPLRQEMLEGIASVETPDDSTVVLTLTAPNAGFLASCMIAIIPEGSGPKQAATPIGAGPFEFVSYTAGISLQMKRFEDYYGEKPQVSTAEFRIFNDASAGQLAAQNGEIHLITGVVGANITYDEKTLKMESVPSNTVQLLALNHEFEPFQKLAVRQALCHAINKADVIKAASPHAQQIDTGFCPVMSLYYEDKTEGYYAYDPARARELLESAGYGEGELSFTIRVGSNYKINVDTATIIQQQLGEVGVKVELDVIEWNTWLSEVYDERKHEATVVGFTGKIDPAPILRRYETGYSRNFINYSNALYDSVLATAASVADPNERAEHYKNAQLILTQEAVSVFLMDPSNNILMDRRLQGYRTYPMNYIDLRGVYFEG